MPNGANDQDDALIGQRYARKLINRVVRKIENGTGIPRERMILAGFSAGAVMAIQVAACSEKPFAGVICHSGAILNPDALPRCRCQDTDFLLTHCVDDVIFEWYERYLPMKNALKEKGYTVWTVEEWEGYHSITDRQLLRTKSFIEAVLKNKKRE
jgi:predicted esterase